ncbi:helix-turn-helix transcriptional regulator [Chryseosolibacter indicus]|uniref:Helix-turn-helix transcriptional regulator n=1 Tax=Chryseosolibacter indicus TaxID=2782351 RepID=A0ABS5VTP9_9BACT|nr:helix-turn-helix transcriptional regulator [Chryseosolibacter indicus]MBT1704793.1 helix-turn-helix transcriptional regulator [Chryseosolibacter indicus]
MTSETGAGIKYEQISFPQFNGFVQYLWRLESHLNDTSIHSFGPLVDGCPGLIVQLGKDGSMHDENGNQLPRAFLYGQTIKLTKLYLAGKFKIIGVRFFPNVLKPLFKFNSSELTDSCVEVDALPKHKDFNLIERLCEAQSQKEQVNILSSYLSSISACNDLAPDPVTQYVLNELIQSKGNISLPKVQKAVNLSERSLERRFEQHVGVSPKLYSRICRFQASLTQLKQSSFLKLSDIAFDNGYADQSHFIRSFREFSGYAPKEFWNYYHNSGMIAIN